MLRLNYDGRGEYLGEFQSEDTILVVQNSGEFYATNFDLNNHYDDGIRVLEKYDPNKVWTAVLYDACLLYTSHGKTLPIWWQNAGKVTCWLVVCWLELCSDIITRVKRYWADSADGFIIL